MQRREPVRLDLHIHTTASDGSWSPEAVVHGAIAGGLDVIAIADHDTCAAIPSARQAAGTQQLQVIPAIEVSSSHDGRDVHVLGYGIDPEAAAITDHTRRATLRRDDRMRQMLERLRWQGIDVPFSAVEAAAGPDRVVIGRPHLAQALVTEGHATSVWDAFDRLIGDDAEAFVPAHVLDPAGAIELVRAAGGIPVWAHPPAELVDTLLPVLKAAGLQGLEVYRPRSKRAQVLRLESICRTAGLLMTGGSDWHNPDGGAVLGDFHVSSGAVERFLEAVEI
jgi:predicted metal-dependent phosphoesterase TrpH